MKEHRNGREAEIMKEKLWSNKGRGPGAGGGMPLQREMPGRSVDSYGFSLPAG